MIFVSYSDRDRERVEPLVIDLGLLGHNVYFEEKSLGSSHDWDEIFTNIEHSDAFIYTITQNTQLSYSRMLEYEQAQAFGKPIIPIRLEDIDLWLLPPGLPAIIDYHPGNQAERAELARVVHALPPPLPDIPPIARPEISFALAQLHERIESPEKSPPENAAILLNLQEFLERRETFASAALMLDNFSQQIGSIDPLAERVARTRAQIQRPGRRKARRSRGWALKGLFGLAMIGAFLWVLRSASMSKIIGDPGVVAQNADLPLVATPTLFPTNTLAFPTNTLADVLAYSLQATTSPTKNHLPSMTPGVTSWPTTGQTSQYLSVARATHPPATATSQPPSATHPVLAATHSPPTSTRLPATANHPPTQAPTHVPPPTLVPPIIKTVLPPPTHVPPPTQPPPPTQAPPISPPTLVPPIIKTVLPLPTHAPPPTKPPPQPPPTQAPPPTHVPPPTKPPPPIQAPPISLPTLAPPIVKTILPPPHHDPPPTPHNDPPPPPAPPNGNHGSGNGHGNGNHGSGNGHGNH